MTISNRKTTTERNLGWEHQKNRRRLIAKHIDGTPCPCGVGADCGPACLCRKAGYALPMYRSAALNPDGLPLDADHSQARSQGGMKADRLMLASCNRSRGDGTRDNLMSPWWDRDWSGTFN